MYPVIEIIPWILKMYTFGMAMSLAFIVFFYTLNRLTHRAGIHNNIFVSIALFSISILFFGRIFYILAEWREFGTYFEDIGTYWKQILLMKDYAISLMGGVFGFFLVFFFLTRDVNRDKKTLLDIVVFSFMIPAVIGYVGAFFWGQIYGKPTSWLGITPNPEVSNLGSLVPIFPLALLYALTTLLIFFFLFSLRKKKTYSGFIAYVGMALFWAMLFLGEFLNGSNDMFQWKLGLTLSQIGGLIFIAYALFGMLGKKR